ncbi:FadR/GntR family transcriptional regulator [Pseudonocardia benzenivorans]|uniref:FadR/GntR family transcriptional regulator n=1 Tax=Pseudonocardia benzenivorans TaxID=228005 RepID=A0ABW3VM77_9PSEU|nr:FadR/GntR family transcriptional regulator [Pseudonocardia dioxanivorans]
MATLAETVADALLDAVVAGRYPAGTALPPEGELAAAHGASRLTVREAVRILRATNVLEVRRGLGTFVTAPERWRSLDLLVRAHHAGEHGSAVPELLLEARRMVEVGAAQLAAVRRTDEHLAQLRAGVEEMRAAAAAGDVDVFVDADIAFHDTVMRATGNVFVPFLLEPFGELLVAARRQTSAVPRIRDNAVAEHARIVDALEAADPDRAREAMESHMSQTQSDLRAHVLGVNP